MKSVRPSTRISKRSWGEASTTATASDAMLTIEEAHVDPTIAMDPSGGDDDVDPTVTPPLSLCAMINFEDLRVLVYRGSSEFLYLGGVWCV